MRGLHNMADAFEAGVWAASVSPALRYIVIRTNCNRAGFLAGLRYAQRGVPAND